MGRTTKIRILDEVWDVPRGFGAVYQCVIREHLSLLDVSGAVAVSDLLALIGYQASPEQVSGWNLRKRVEAVVYAVTELARASDNHVRRHPRPLWLPERAWQGPDQGEGAFAGPSGTPIVGAPN